MKSLLVVILFILCMPLAAQVPTFDELEFEPDSITAPYKPAGKHFVLVRSKRGTNGVPKTPRADSVTTLPVNEIVLVFSELNSSALEERETANRERWENLLKTYPEYFQFSTTFKNLCQCNNNGDSAAFKLKQGFYVYYTAEEPKAEEKKVVAKKVEEAPPVKAAPVAEAPKPAKVKEAPAKKEAPAAKEEKEEKTVKEKRETVKEKKEPAKETVKETVKEPEAPAETSSNGQEQTLTISAADMKESPQKKAGYSKPRRSKDLKACRPPCYENGDEDLNTFFKDNITFTKKQKKQAKKAISVVKLQLNFDGSIKKAMVTGENEEINQLVLGAIKNMNLWNPAVKNGVTVKSEVKITLKYDSETKALRPSETMITPRPAPKCKCMSDAEIFGTE